MNRGACFSNSLESVYNIYRRYLIANPLHYHNNFSTIHAIINRHIKHEIPLNDAIVVLQPDRDKWNLPNEVIRQCEECSKIIFHSFFFNCLWLSKCPIHNCTLSLRCPRCKKNWPDTHQLSNRSCSGCGSTINDEAYIQRRLTKQDIEKKLDPLTRILDAFSSIEKLATTGQVRRPTSDLSQLIIPSVLNKLGILHRDFLNRLSVDIKPIKVQVIKNEELAEKPTDESEYHHMNTVLHDIKLSVVSKVASIISETCPSTHMLSTSVISLGEPCLYCEAFFIWIKLIFYNEIPNPRIASNVTPVAPTIFLLSGGEHIGYIPFNIQKILFERDLESSFLFILRQLQNQKKEKCDGSGNEATVVSNLFSGYTFLRHNGITYFAIDTSEILSKNEVEIFGYQFDYQYCIDKYKFIDLNKWNEHLVISNSHIIEHVIFYYTNHTMSNYFYPLTSKYYISEYIKWTSC